MKTYVGFRTATFACSREQKDVVFYSDIFRVVWFKTDVYMCLYIQTDACIYIYIEI